MPYIHKRSREHLDKPLRAVSKAVFELVEHRSPTGTLNYCITKLLLSTNPQSYDDYNSLIGVLECCKLEFYRRAVAAYEDEKIEENGDVYPERAFQ